MAASQHTLTQKLTSPNAAAAAKATVGAEQEHHSSRNFFSQHNAWVDHAWLQPTHTTKTIGSTQCAGKLVCPAVMPHAVLWFALRRTLLWSVVMLCFAMLSFAVLPLHCIFSAGGPVLFSF